MRSIETTELKEERQKKKARLISALLLLMLLGSVAGYAFLSQGDTAAPAAPPAQNGQFTTDYQGTQLAFTSPPSSVTAIQAPYVTINQYAGKPLYIVSDSEAITYEISSTLGRYVARWQPACYGNCTEDLPSKDCTENLIVWNQSDENKISQQDSCVFIDGDIRAVDAFLYKVFGIQ
ncbi:hypothetical protein KW805_04605 [Candidatus Pacearchaeota archaeon]|nr:hypothetical protein [Candidatus Pacearchaeota archaeon]